MPRTMVDDLKLVLLAISRVRFTSMILTVLILACIGGFPVLFMASGIPLTLGLVVFLAATLYGSGVLALTIVLTYITAVSLYGPRTGLSSFPEREEASTGLMKLKLHILILKIGILATASYTRLAAAVSRLIGYMKSTKSGKG